MLIITIHGFRPRLTPWEHIPFFGQFFRPEPDIWKTANEFTDKFSEQSGDSYVQLMRFGFKDIVYKPQKKWLFWKRGRDKTISSIKSSYKKQPSRIIIFGHSLGGWAANILVDELLKDEELSPLLGNSEVGKITLIQVDALPLTTRSRPITQEWVTDEGKDLLNQVFDFIADLLDDIDKNPIYPEYLEKTESGVPRHQQTYNINQVFKHLNFYCKKGSWDASNHIVHFATLEEVAEIDSDAENLTNIGVDASHLEIDKPGIIISRLSDDLYGSWF